MSAQRKRLDGRDPEHRPDDINLLSSDNPWQSNNRLTSSVKADTMPND
jgi:hypothetical protein